MVTEDGKVVIHAVHERDAKEFWKKLKLKDVEKCIVCGKDVTYDSFSAVSPWDGKIVVVCDDGPCFFKFTIMKRNRMLEKEAVPEFRT